MKPHRIAAILLALAFAAPLAAPLAAQAKKASLPADSMVIGRKYTAWFYSGQADSLLAHMEPGASQAMPKEALLNQLSQMTARAGAEVEVLEEKFITRNGNRQYWRSAKFSSFDEPLLVRWVITPAGTIAGFGLGPKSQAPAIDP